MAEGKAPLVGLGDPATTTMYGIPLWQLLFRYPTRAVHRTCTDCCLSIGPTMHLRDIIVDHQYRSGWAIGLFLLFFLGYRYFRLAHAVVQSQLLFWGTVVVSIVVATTYALYPSPARTGS